MLLEGLIQGLYCIRNASDALDHCFVNAAMKLHVPVDHRADSWVIHSICVQVWLLIERYRICIRLMVYLLGLGEVVVLGWVLVHALAAHWLLLRCILV
jgi:hypothetical protein